jgi:hypothetical protein
LGGYRKEKKTITMGPHAAAAISFDFPYSQKMVYGKVYRDSVDWARRGADYLNG